METFGVWIPRFLSSIETKNYSAETIRGYARTLVMFGRYKTYLGRHHGVPPTGVELLADLSLNADVGTDAYEMGDFFTMIRNERQLKPTSMRRYETALSSFYRYLVSLCVVYTNPMDRVERPKLKICITGRSGSSSRPSQTAG